MIVVKEHNTIGRTWTEYVCANMIISNFIIIIIFPPFLFYSLCGSK